MTLYSKGQKNMPVVCIQDVCDPGLLTVFPLLKYFIHANSGGKDWFDLNLFDWHHSNIYNVTKMMWLLKRKCANIHFDKNEHYVSH